MSNIRMVDMSSSDQDIDSSIFDILANIERIENQLGEWDKLFKGSSVFNKIMNIPQSSAEDLSFIEKALNEEESTCAENMKEELKELFEKLTTLLKFDGIVQNVQELQSVVKEKKKEAEDHLQLVTELDTKEKQAKAVYKESQILLNILEDLKDILDDLNVSNISEIDGFIQLNENEIEVYSKVITCYTQFLENCHIKSPSDIYVVPECLKDCNNI